MCASAACIGDDCRGGVRALGAGLVVGAARSAACLPRNEQEDALQGLVCAIAFARQGV